MGVWIEIIHKYWNGIKDMVTPLVGVWIEIPVIIQTVIVHTLSLPLWECGLKYKGYIPPVHLEPSLPLWECGLK